MDDLQILRRPEAMKLLNMSASSFDDLRRRDATFPRPIQLGARSVGFFRREIEQWLASRPRVSSHDRPRKTRRPVK